MTGPETKTYEDLLANDAALFVGYRRWMIDHGIFEIPLNPVIHRDALPLLGLA